MTVFILRTVQIPSAILQERDRMYGQGSGSHTTSENQSSGRGDPQKASPGTWGDAQAWHGSAHTLAQPASAQPERGVPRAPRVAPPGRPGRRLGTTAPRRPCEPRREAPRRPEERERRRWRVPPRWSARPPPRPGRRTRHRAVFAAPGAGRGEPAPLLAAQGGAECRAPGAEAAGAAGGARWARRGWRERWSSSTA